MGTTLQKDSGTVAGETLPKPGEVGRVGPLVEQGTEGKDDSK